MSKIKIQGNSSGTGVLTLEAPNTATDRTITLPDATGTLLNSDGDGSSLTSLPQSFTGAVTATTDMVVHAGGAARKMFMGISSDDLAIGNYSSSNTVRNEHLKITSDGRGLSQFTAKAWINFNGTGTVAIRDSHNISSIVDGGTGYYTVNIDVDMANANYALSVASGRNDTSSGYHEICWIAHGTYPAASNFVLSTGTSHHAGVTGGTQQDHHTVCAVVFGD